MSCGTNTYTGLVRWMEIAVSSWMKNGKCGHTEAGFTRITSSILTWIKQILPKGGY